MNNDKKRMLGRTDLAVGRLGVAASYGAPSRAFEEAFEYGCNYFYWGSGRKKTHMTQAVRNLCAKGKRDNLVVAVQTYARTGLFLESIFMRRLKTLKIDHADVLILGWHNRVPFKMLLDRAMKMKEKGMFRYLGISGHNRSAFPKLAQTGCFDIFHIRYNAAHRGAETDCFPVLTGENKSGIVSYTATRQGYLLNPKKMPPGESPLNAADCYRFAMANPAVNVCLCGPKDMDQMRQALKALEQGPLGAEEMDRIRRIGDHVHKTVKVF